MAETAVRTMGDLLSELVQAWKTKDPKVFEPLYGPVIDSLRVTGPVVHDLVVYAPDEHEVGRWTIQTPWWPGYFQPATDALMCEYLGDQGHRPIPKPAADVPVPPDID